MTTHLCMYLCFPLLILRSEMLPSRRRYHLTVICLRDTCSSHLGLNWLLPKNIVYYCPGCSKSFASVGLVKNLPRCSGTHSKGLSPSCFDGALVFGCSIQRRHFVSFLPTNWLSWTSLQRQLKKLEDVYSSRIKDVSWAPLQTLQKSSNITGQNRSPGFIHIVLIK